MAKPKYTAELLKAQEQGATIVVSLLPYEGEEVRYAPRKKGDSMPWVRATRPDSEASSYHRYNGRECHPVWPEGVAPVKQVRPLTETMSHVLHALINNNDGSWHPGCGWHWANRSQTVRLLDSLVRRGYAVCLSNEQYKERYEVTEAGRQAKILL
jgi:hypothetical protein